jgi:CAAX prenyl protease-like protein
MISVRRLITGSPAAARVVPFAVFLAMTVCQEVSGETGRYWFYVAKLLVGLWLLREVCSVVPEMRWALSWEAVAVGIFVFGFWIGLDRVVPNQEEFWARVGLGRARPTGAAGWNPFNQFGTDSAMGWFFVVSRLLGSSLVVPPLEEIFYRSFLYRWLADPNFQNMPLGRFSWKPFLVAALIFGFAHNDWLAGILCGFCYQGLVCWKKRLGDAITAHAITNALLGLWVIVKGAWHFW